MMGNKIQPFPSLRCIAGITVFSSLLSKENKISALANLGCFQVKKMPGWVTNAFYLYGFETIFLRKKKQTIVIHSFPSLRYIAGLESFLPR